ncbi:MAG: Hsp20/alpha crystallin family protein [Deltaproteobacteria bacterium]|nr:Hsp20/alpha crystallin family protein [Deltaproteobacteria bacterium]
MAFPTIFRGYPVHLDTADPLGSFDRAVEGLWRGLGAAAPPVPAGFAPRIDVVEREGEYLVTAELPGLEEKDFQLEVHGNALTLTGEKRVEREEERKGWRWSERASGSFRRSIQLPDDVAADKASASFRNGVLAITLPKAEHARVRHIPVTTA